MISIDKFAGLVTNASPYSIPPGAAVTQVNVQCISPGQLTVRQGLQAYTFASTVAATRPVISAFAFPHGSGPIVVYQDAAGNVFSGSVPTSGSGGGFSGVPSAPQSVSATAASGSATVTWSLPAFFGGGSGITGYSVQVSSDGGTTWAFAASTTALSVTVSGLTNGQAYVFRAAATNQYGIGSYSPATSSVTPVGAPESPVNLTASAGSASAVLSWAVPANNGGTAITDYRVEYKLLSASSWSVFADGTSTTTTATVTGLTNGQQYVFRVAAINAAGTSDYATYMTPVMPVGVPDQITTLTATYGNALVTLVWQAPAANNAAGLTDYIIQRSTDDGATWTTLSDGLSLDTTYVVTQLANGTAYRFRVAAVNAVGTGPYSSPTASVTPRTLPGTPTGLSTTPGNAQAVLSWTAPASNGGAAITDYRIQVSVAGGAYSTITRSASTATSYTATSLTNGTSYTFRVAAVNSEGAGSYVTGTAVTPQTVPLAPTNVLTTTGDAQVTVRWTAPTDTGGSAITDYTLQYSTDGTTWSTFPHTATTATQITVTNLTNGVAYTFRVAAVSAVGTGNYSTASSPATPLGVPGVPLNPALTGGNTQVFASWDPPSSDGGSVITGYVLQYRVNVTNGQWITYGTVSGVLSYTIAGLTNGNPYVFRVAAVNAVGTGQYTAQTPSTGSVTPGATPLAPTGLTISNPYATSLTDSSVTLSWNAPTETYGSRLTDYIIQYSTSSGTQAVWTTYADGVSTATTATLTGINPTVQYFYRVAAVSTVGAGAYTATFTGQPYRIVNPPGTPVVTASVGSGSVSLSWPAVTTGNAPLTLVTVNADYYASNAAAWYTTTSIPSTADLGSRTALVQACKSLPFPDSYTTKYRYGITVSNFAYSSTRGVSGEVLVSNLQDSPASAPTLSSVSLAEGVAFAVATKPFISCWPTGYGVDVDYSVDGGTTWTACASFTSTSSRDIMPTTPSLYQITNSGSRQVSISPAPTAPFKIRVRQAGATSYAADPYAVTGTLTPATSDSLFESVYALFNANTRTLKLRGQDGSLTTQTVGTASGSTGKFGSLISGSLNNFGVLPAPTAAQGGLTIEWWQQAPYYYGSDANATTMCIAVSSATASLPNSITYYVAQIVSRRLQVCKIVDSGNGTVTNTLWYSYLFDTAAYASPVWCHMAITDGFDSRVYCNGRADLAITSTGATPLNYDNINGAWVESCRVTYARRYPTTGSSTRQWLPPSAQFLQS